MVHTCGEPNEPELTVRVLIGLFHRPFPGTWSGASQRWSTCNNNNNTVKHGNQVGVCFLASSGFVALAEACPLMIRGTRGMSAAKQTTTAWPPAHQRRPKNCTTVACVVSCNRYREGWLNDPGARPAAFFLRDNGSVSRAVQLHPDGGQFGFRLAPRTYDAPPCGPAARVVSLTKSRKNTHQKKYYRSFW